MSARISILDLAIVRAGGTVAEAFRRSLDLAQHAERWGYTRFWLAEHHNMPGIASSATSVLIGHIAAGTTSIRVGSGGIMLPNHAPLMIAEQFGTLEALFPGRIDLGIGRAPGGDTVTARVIRRGLGGTLDDFPSSVQELLGYFAAPSPERAVRAVPGENCSIPVWLLGSSTYSAHLAAQLGLPFAFASHFAPEMLHEALATYRQYFRPSAALSKPYTMIGVPLVAADSDAEAERLATTIHQRFLQLLRGEGLFSRPPVESMEGLWNPSERSVLDRKLAVAVIGGPEVVRVKLNRLLETTGADELMFTSDLYEHADRLRSFEIAQEVLRPALAA